jgi:Asp-tRNA(Asn)/Glu-tRNA(Gln) amidotransferase A subunit family amidase
MWTVAFELAKRVGGDPGYPGLYGPGALRAPTRPERLIVIEAEGWKDVEPESARAFAELLGRLRSAGVQIVDRKDNPVIEMFERAISDSLVLCRDICAYEMRWSLQNLLEEFGGGLSDSLMTRYEISKSMSIDDYRVLLVRREEARRALAAVASAGDAMICLSSVGPAPLMDNAGVDSGVSHTTGSPAFNAWTSQLGAPSINLPLLAVGGLPLGVQIVGQHHSDHLLSGIGNWICSQLL